MDRGLDANEPQAAKQRLVARVRLLWEARKLLLITMLLGGLGSLGIALLIPARYEATTQLMPPEGQSGSGMAMLSALAGRAGGFGGAAGDLLGVKNSGALFVGILESRTVQDRLIAQFDLKRLYNTAKMEDTRAVLAVHAHQRGPQERDHSGDGHGPRSTPRGGLGAGVCGRTRPAGRTGQHVFRTPRTGFS